MPIFQTLISLKIKMKKLLLATTVSVSLVATGIATGKELSVQEAKVAANCWNAASVFVDNSYTVEPVKVLATIGKGGQHAAGIIAGYKEKDGGMRRTVPVLCTVNDSGRVEKLQIGAFVVFKH